MEKKNNFRARVMKYAWQLWRTTKNQWRICMIKAWKLYKLAKAMREGVVEFVYSKADGSTRLAHGTLKNVPAGSTFRGKKLTKPSYKTMTYYDVDRNAFRSFRVENLIQADLIVQ